MMGGYGYLANWTNDVHVLVVLHLTRRSCMTITDSHPTDCASVT